ncbi:MAG TPA: alpha/beta fold hydrolase [Labilithrix sp.]|jgi:alpha-beta hydrolase superfamily lysophospholipase|nr:alpha/beta fold hydrolase [Labilithrix sp.]
MSEPIVSSFGQVPVRIFEARPAARTPAVLLFHGLRSSADTLDREARALAAAGMTAILPDAPHHGVRSSVFLKTMPDTATREGYARLLAIFRESRDEIPSLVDHVLARGHDTVAIAGVSMGGYIALAAAAVEPRLAAFASLLGSPDWTPHEGEAAAAAGAYAAELSESPHLRPEVFAPRPLLFLNGAHDVNVPPGPARALAERLCPIYERAGAPDALMYRAYETGHFVPPAIWDEMVETAVTFLGRTLLARVG